MGVQLPSKLTVEEYFAMDDASERPLEYHNGDLFPMVAASPQRSVILVNVSHCLASLLKGGPCFAAGAPRVRTTGSNYVYPDIAVICGGFEYSAESANAITNPKVIVEILSPTTADFDHGGKFALYSRLPSFTEYVLIAQDQAMIEVFYKESEVQWILRKYEGMNSIIRIRSLEIEIPATEIYAGIEFPAV